MKNQRRLSLRCFTQEKPPGTFDLQRHRLFAAASCQAAALGFPAAFGKLDAEFFLRSVQQIIVAFRGAQGIAQFKRVVIKEKMLEALGADLGFGPLGRGVQMQRNALLFEIRDKPRQPDLID